MSRRSLSEYLGWCDEMYDLDAFGPEENERARRDRLKRRIIESIFRRVRTRRRGEGGDLIGVGTGKGGEPAEGPPTPAGSANEVA